MSKTGYFCGKLKKKEKKMEYHTKTIKFHTLIRENVSVLPLTKAFTKIMLLPRIAAATFTTFTVCVCVCILRNYNTKKKEGKYLHTHKNITLYTY